MLNSIIDLSERENGGGSETMEERGRYGGGKERAKKGKGDGY